MSSEFQVLDNSVYPKNFKSVDWDKLKVGEGKDLIGTECVGPCLAITLYDPYIKKGVLAHLTQQRFAPDELKPENIVDTLLHNLNGCGNLDPRKLEASLAGESFIGLERELRSPFVKAKLMESGIPIIGEDLKGKRIGRSVFLYCATGKIEVYRFPV